jgi:hypothetical protein
MERVMRVILVLLLLAHGIAHLPGFLVNWQLRSFPELPFRTTLFAGTLDVGLIGIRAVGVGWLLVAIAFGFAALGVLLRSGWWAATRLWRGWRVGSLNGGGMAGGTPRAGRQCARYRSDCGRAAIQLAVVSRRHHSRT